MAKQRKNGTYIDSKLLSDLRKSKGLSQEALAEKAHISKRSIEDYERQSVAGLRPSSAKRLAEALGVPLDTLLVAKVDVPKPEPPTTPLDENLNVAITQDNEITSQPLYLNSHADSILRSACSGLLSNKCSANCVSNAIANISGYLYHLVGKIPKLKEHSYLIVSNSISALASAVLEESCAANGEMWSGFKICMSELANLPQLPDYAKKEALDAIGMMAHSRMTDNMELKYKAVRSCLFWLSDNWQFIYQSSYAYSVFRYVSNMLTAAPTDYRIREQIITGINAFVAFIEIFDTNGIYHQEGDTNEQQ